MIDADKSYGMVIVDAFRAQKIHRECELFFRRQIEGEDMIVINKIELVDEAKLQDVRDLVPPSTPRRRSWRYRPRRRGASMRSRTPSPGRRPYER